MKARFHWLLHPVFLVCLVLLLLNDLLLKYSYGNYFTGKLSDFSGLVVAAVFLFAVVPADRKKIILTLALFFLWWKSSWSDPVIAYLNTHLSLPVTRVVDYSDYMALAVLPAVLLLKQPPSNPEKWRYAGISLSGLLCLFAFCATSYPYYSGYEPFRKNEIPFTELIKSKKTDKEILYALDPQRRGWKTDSVRFLPMRNGESRPYTVLQTPGDSLPVWIPLPDSLPLPLYHRSVSTPFYIIPEYILDGDTLLNLEFSIDNCFSNGKKRCVSFHSFRSKDEKKYADFYYGPLRRKYAKHFRRLLAGN